MEKMIEVLLSIENDNLCDERTLYISDKIIYFINELNLFKSMYNSKNIDSDKLIYLGKELNSLRDSISLDVSNIVKKYVNVFKRMDTFEDKLYVFSISCLPSFSKIPSNILTTLINTSMENTYQSSIKDYFLYDYQHFYLWKKVYEKNREFGIAKYISLNNKIKKNMECTLADLYIDSTLSIDQIIDFTSHDNKFALLKSNEKLKYIQKNVN